MKIICDSSSIITLADNCLIYLLEAFARKGTELIIPPAIRKETIDTPISTRRFKFEAVRIQEAVKKGWVKIHDNNSQKEEMRKIANRIMDAANSLFLINGRPLRIVQYGEAEALALARVTGTTTILVDEKNTRMLIESPEAMAEFMAKRMGRRIEINHESLKLLKNELRGLEVIRSAELVMVALEQGLLDHYMSNKDKTAEKDLVTGILYALRNSGCAITETEIDEYYRTEVA